MIACWVDGERNSVIPVTDRGIQYGDGAFTTIRVYRGKPCWLDEHLLRLQEAANRLKLLDFVREKLITEVESVAAFPGVGIIKVILTRGDGIRGYSPIGASGRRIVTAYPPLASNAADYRNGITVRFCDLRLSAQPLLAGLKHLNRLEQVMARSEWQDNQILEGIICDEHDQIIAATSANIFARFGQQLRTPVLDRCGVAGVCRDRILQSPPLGFSVAVTAIARAELLTADELFITNCARGVVPISKVGNINFASHQAAQMLMQQWHPEIGLPSIRK